MDKSKLIEKYLKIIGKPASAVKDGQSTGLYIVSEQFQRRNRYRFEESSSEIGRYYNDYYYYIGPSSFDIFSLGGEDYIEIDGERYFFIQKHKVRVGNIIQYYRGVLKKAEEENDVFAI